MVLWGYSPLIYSQTSNWKSNSEIYKCKFIKQVVSRWFKLQKKSVCWVCVFTQKGHIVDILPYSQLGCLPYWFAEEHNCDMHPHSAKSHFIKYAGLGTSDYAINTISSCVLVFHCHHQWIHWRRFLPKSTLYGWLWGYGIRCYTIDSRCGVKFIYNKDQLANTYGSVWGRFPVGKIWSSHSNIKSRFDKPLQNRSPLNFSELPHWLPPHRFRWKSTTIKSRSDKP